MTKSVEVLSIALDHGVHADGKLYRLKRGSTLRLVPGPSLLGRRVALYCNYPVTGNFNKIINLLTSAENLIYAVFYIDKAEFIRNQYLHLNWFSIDGKKLTDGLHPYNEITDLDIYCEIETNRSGTFNFYFIYQDW